MAAQNITLSHITKVEDFSAFILFIKEQRQVLLPSNIYTKEGQLLFNTALSNYRQFHCSTGRMHKDDWCQFYPQMVFFIKLLISIAWHRCNITACQPSSWQQPAHSAAPSLANTCRTTIPCTNLVQLHWSQTITLCQYNQEYCYWNRKSTKIPN